LAWPSASAGQQTTTFSNNVNCIDGNSGHQFPLYLPSISGPITVDHCDIWGFGNAIVFTSSTAPITVNACWIHDAANDSPQSYHTDGPGYENGSTAPQNISITNCTVASIGNTQAIAFQAATSPYANITVSGCYLSGFGATVDMCHNTPGNSALTFTNNTFGTDLPWVFRPLYDDYTNQFRQAGFTWSGNKLKVLPGTSPWSGSLPAWVQGDDGKFLWPDFTLHTIDF
jgi:hypothetical protein